MLGMFSEGPRRGGPCGCPNTGWKPVPRGIFILAMREMAKLQRGAHKGRPFVAERRCLWQRD